MSKYNEAFPVRYQGKDYLPTKNGWVASDDGQDSPIALDTKQGQEIVLEAKSSYDILSFTIISSILTGNYDAQTEITA